MDSDFGEDLWPWHPLASFNAPIDDPGTAPGDSPYVCIFLNRAWQAILAGCAMQVAQPATWLYSTHAEYDDLMARATALVNLIALAKDAVPSEDGTATLTILAGNATAVTTITLAGTYASAPHPLASASDIHLLASWSNATTTTFDLHLTAAVPVTADTTADVSWAVFA